MGFMPFPALFYPSTDLPITGPSTIDGEFINSYDFSEENGGLQSKIRTAGYIQQTTDGTLTES